MTVLTLDRQIADDLVSDCPAETPTQAQFERWIQAALAANGYEKDEAEVSLRICTAAEIQALNHDYRDRDKATNVLSLPTDFPAEMQIPLLGDIIICARVVEDEAESQHKPAIAHWAHMTVHSVLHLLGHDHIDEIEAEAMEALETDILIGLGYNNPYQSLD